MLQSGGDALRCVSVWSFGKTILIECAAHIRIAIPIAVLVYIAILVYITILLTGGGEQTPLSGALLYYGER